jgi:hypothetical protein
MNTSSYYLGRRLISCGTIIVVAGLLLIGFQNWLSATDVRDHRSIASSMLRESGINRVTLSEWEAPSSVLSWMALLGGFVVIAVDTFD